MQKKQKIEKDIIEYNASIGKSKLFEKANFARMQGNLERMIARQAELKLAQIETIAFYWWKFRF